MLLRLLGEATERRAADGAHRHENAHEGLTAHVGRHRRLRFRGRGVAQTRRARPDPDGLPGNDGRGPARWPGTSARSWQREWNVGPSVPTVTDYYEVLGVSPRRDRRTRSRRRTAGSPASCTRTSTRTRRRRSGSRRSRSAYEVLVRPGEAPGATTSAATRCGGTVPAAASAPGFALHRHHGRVLRRQAAAARAARRGPRRGQDALIRLEIELAEAAFGATQRAPGRHRGRLPDLHGEGRPAGHRAAHLRHVPRPRRGAAGARAPSSARS